MNQFVKVTLARQSKFYKSALSRKLYFMIPTIIEASQNIYIPPSQIQWVTPKTTQLRYQVPHLDNVEHVEKCRSGGYHPIHLGDTFKEGRYRVLHKLGYGGFSTVWLALDKNQDALVSLKVLTAEASRQSTELNILQHLSNQAQGNPWRRNVISSLDRFSFKGPNGTHLCYVSQLGGPSISAMTHSPGEVTGTRRLRAPLARRLAQQLAGTVSLMHEVEVVHGGMLLSQDPGEVPNTQADITPKNVLLGLKGLDGQPLESIFKELGNPVKDSIFTFSGQKPDLSAPEYLVEPAIFSGIEVASISEQILIIDLGEAFQTQSPPSYGVGTPVSYCSPELILESKASKASDIWALACTIFELRSGFPLFESFTGSSKEVLEEMGRLLGPPPTSTHSLWRKNEITVAQHAQINELALGEHVGRIGMDDHDVYLHDDEATAPNNHTSLHEPLGRGITGDEANDLTDMLRRALNYTPEKRLSAGEIANHPWLTNGV